MTILTVDLPTSVYERLRLIAQQQHTSIEAVVQAWLTERSAADLARDERERATAALRAAGLLTELSTAEKVRAARSMLTLDKARAILDRAGGNPLLSCLKCADQALSDGDWECLGRRPTAPTTANTIVVADIIPNPAKEVDDAAALTTNGTRCACVSLQVVLAACGNVRLALRSIR